MKRFNLLVFNTLILSLSLNAQAYSVKEYLSLTGEVHILTFFIETRYDYWEEKEMEHYSEQLQKSQEWLVQEAAFHGKNLRFDNDHFYIDNMSQVYLDDIRYSTHPKRNFLLHY